MTFKDLFSERATLYAAYRPQYPDSLFAFLAGLTSGHHTALDCGTGNGQAAIGLADHFQRVIATDPSPAQIQNAIPHPRIEYRVASADSSGLRAGSVDLVTAAQSLHWFEPAAFFAEAKRVLVRNGALAVWGYGDPILDDVRLHETLHSFNRGLLEPYWYPERKILLDGYRTISFPFDEVATPTLELEMRWTLSELVGYLRTWSAASRYAAEHGTDPVKQVEKTLAEGWGDPASRRVIRWPLALRAGKNAGADPNNSRGS